MKTGRKLNLLIIAGILILIFLVLNIKLNTGVPARDSGTFLYIGQQILDGKVPYRDIWDHKPPLIYFINSLSLIIDGNTLYGLWTVEFISLSIASILCFFMIRKSFGIVTAFLTLILFLFSFGKLFEGGNFTEEYALLFQFLCLYIFIKGANKNRLLDYFLIGIFSALIFFLRQNSVGITFAIVGFLTIRGIRRNYHILFKKLIYLLFGFFFVAAVILFYLLSKNALNDFIDQVFRYNLIYSSVKISERLNTVLFGLKILPIQFLLVFLSYFMGLFYLFSEKRGKIFKSDLIGLAMILFPIELILVGLSRRHFWHYYISWLPVFTILWGYIIFMTMQFVDRSIINILHINKRYLGALLISTIFVLAYSEDFVYLIKTNYEFRLITKKLEPRLWRFNNIDAHAETINLINKYTAEYDYVLIWGRESAINFVTKRGSPTRYVYQYPLFYLNYTTDKKIGEFIDGVRNKKPKLIIDASDSTFDNEVDQGRILPIDSNNRAELLARSEEPDKYKGFNEFYEYVDLNCERIGFTYDNKWQVYKNKEGVTQ